MGKQLFICPVCGKMDTISHCTFCKSDNMIITTYISNLTNSKMEEQAINEYVRSGDMFDESKYQQRLKEEKDWEEGRNPHPYWQTPEYLENLEKDIKANQPHCPVCGSANIHKISAANKVGAAAVFGIFAIGHVSKTYKCDNCGAKF